MNGYVCFYQSKRVEVYAATKEGVEMINLEHDDDTVWNCSRCGLQLNDNFGKAIGVEGSDDAFCSVVCLEAWTQKRIQDAVANATEFFWHIVAGKFPEAHNGDLSPDAVIAFEQAATKAVTAWVKTNTQLLND